jgi:hypothetical protein
VWCLPTCMVPSQLYTTMSGQLCSMLSYYCTYMTSAQLNDVCSTGWCLPTWMIFSYLYDVRQPVGCLLNWIKSIQLHVSSYLYDIRSTSAYLVTSAQLCDIYSAVFLPTCMMSALLYDVPYRMISFYVYDVCSAVHIISLYLDDVFPLV